MWSLVVAILALRAAQARPIDPGARLEAEFRQFIPYLPPSGEIGYLEQFDGATDEAVRSHYAAQFALIPRIVIARVGPELVIVARGTARPESDERLRGYYQVAALPQGHRLFRREP